MPSYSRPERRAALRTVLDLERQRELLLRQFPKVQDYNEINDPASELSRYITELARIDKQLSMMRYIAPFEEADWIDKMDVFIRSRSAELVLAIVGVVFLLLIGYLMAVGIAGQDFLSLLRSGLSTVAAAAESPHVLLAPENLKPIVVLFCAFLIGVAFFVFVGIAAASKSPARRRDAHEIVRTIVPFLGGVLTGLGL